MKLGIFKDLRVVILLVCLAGSLIIISPNTNQAVIVKSVSSDSPFYDKLSAGETLDWMNERTIKTVEDVYSFSDFTGVMRFMHNGKLDLVDITVPGLGITVDKKPSSNIKWGMDIVGGTRVLMQPVGNVSDAVVQQIIGTLQTRINVYGLRETNFMAVKDVSGNNYIEIEMAGGTQQEIEDLLAKQGMFESKIPRVVELSNNSGLFWNRSIVRNGDAITIDGTKLGINDSIVIDGIKFEVYNVTASEVVMLGTVFTGTDIKSVCIQEQAGICTSRVVAQTGGYQFIFQVFVSQDGANRFAKLTKDLGVTVDPKTGEAYLNGKIILILDKKIITDLSISADLAGKPLTDPVIQGGREKKEDAISEKLKLQSILQSGALPVELNVIRIDQVSPTLGQGFLYSMAFAGVIGALAVSIIMFIRYRKPKIVIPVVFTSFSEVLMILGMASLIGWTIDLASLVGIIAVIGTGVDSQIMIVDELLMGSEAKIYTFKQRLKHAFFMIFGSAATVIAAMLPLMMIGIGVMRGFAITTTLGVLIGVFIARPAFSRIAEQIIERSTPSA